MAPLGYHAMRLRWCRAALLALLRRWGIYFAVGAALAGAGSSGGLDAVRALAAWSVLPLFRASVEGEWLPSTMVLQSALAGLIVWSLRPLLWPARWAAAERALPLRWIETLRSDLSLVSIALAPLFALYAIGAQALLAPDPAWLHARRGVATAALAVVVVLSIGLGVAVLTRLRRASRRAPAAIAAPSLATSTHAMQVPVMHWRAALVWLPLWRGPARRTGAGLLAALGTLLVPLLLMASLPRWTSWCLSGFALLALVSAWQLRSLAQDDFAAFEAASAPLPLPRDALRRFIAWLPPLPVLVVAPLLLTALPAAGSRWPVLGLFGLGCIVAASLAGRRPATGEPMAAASWWLLGFCVLVALASEATP